MQDLSYRSLRFWSIIFFVCLFRKDHFYYFFFQVQWLFFVDISTVLLSLSGKNFSYHIFYFKNFHLVLLYIFFSFFSPLYFLFLASELLFFHSFQKIFFSLTLWSIVITTLKALPSNFNIWVISGIGSYISGIVFS